MLRRMGRSKENGRQIQAQKHGGNRDGEEGSVEVADSYKNGPHLCAGCIQQLQASRTYSQRRQVLKGPGVGFSGKGRCKDEG